MMIKFNYSNSKSTNKFMVLIITLVLLTACSSEPIKVRACELCFEKYKNELVVTEGFVKLPESFYTAGGSVTLLLVDDSRKRLPTITLKNWGEKKNMMEKLKDGYTEEDVMIYDNDGNIIKLGDKVRVTGELHGASKPWCEINVDKIEKIE